MAMSVVYSNFCGMVVSETRGGVESDYVQDTLGSTIGLMNSAGTMTDRWEYWPYGEVASRSGTNSTPLTFLGVIGYFKDVLDKLFYVRARHLRVDLGRWLTTDPLWPAQPAFPYCTNDPVNCVDPSGLDCWSDFLSCSAIETQIVEKYLGLLLAILLICLIALELGQFELVEGCPLVLLLLYDVIAATSAYWTTKCNVDYYVCEGRNWLHQRGWI